MFFSWYINGTQVDSEADYRYTFIDGNLIISNASEITDYGKYQCKAENSIGIVLSRDALLQFACEYDFSALLHQLPTEWSSDNRTVSQYLLKQMESAFHFCQTKNFYEANT